MNLDKTGKMLEYYEDYYRDNNIEHILEETFPKDFQQKFFSFLGGHDKDGRPGECNEIKKILLGLRTRQQSVWLMVKYFS